MKKSLLTTILILALTTLTNAQQLVMPQWEYYPEMAPAPFSDSINLPAFAQAAAGVEWSRASLNLKELPTVTGSNALFAGRLSFTDPSISLSYSFESSLSGSGTVQPTFGPLVIGGVEFVKTDDKPENIKPLKIGYTVGPAHRLELAIGGWRQGNFTLRPAGVVEWDSLNITVTGEVDGKTKVAGDSLRAFRGGVGAEGVLDNRFSRLRVLALSGEGYSLIRAEYGWWLSNNLDLQLNYSWRTLRFPTATLRDSGVGISGQVRW